ncbi:hypothetical protein [Agrobacterium sp. NPDC090283]|uniref:hypothetical protein n=1 Tax=Agrobacterium sp. NPDC090283 TaxID=3363920 RepID=UPI00383BDA9A
MEYLGFASAFLTVVAALFGLIPPILSKGQNGTKSDESVSSFVRALTPIFVICGLLITYFIFIYGMTALPRFMSSRPSKEVVEIRNLHDADWNLVHSAELISYSSSRNAALVQIVDHGLNQANYPLALLAASKITFSAQRDTELAKIQKAMMKSAELNAQKATP